MPDAGPFGETFFDAKDLAIAAGLLVKRPFGGSVETVFTRADHFFAVPAITFPLFGKPDNAGARGLHLRPKRDFCIAYGLHGSRAEAHFSAS